MKKKLLAASPETRRVAIKSGVGIGLVQDCAPELSALMQSDEDAHCRFDAAIALTEMDDVEILQSVIRFRDQLRKLFHGKERKRMLRQLDAALRIADCRAAAAMLEMHGAQSR